MLPIPISIQGTANSQWKKQSFKTLKNIFKVFLSAQQHHRTDTTGLFTKEEIWTPKSDLAKENPEKQELKI